MSEDEDIREREQAEMQERRRVEEEIFRDINAQFRRLDELYIPSIDIMQGLTVPSELEAILSNVPADQRRVEERVYLMLAAINTKTVEAAEKSKRLNLPRDFLFTQTEYAAHIVVLNYDPNAASHKSLIQPLNGDSDLIGKYIFDVAPKDFGLQGLQDGATLLRKDGVILGVKDRIITDNRYANDQGNYEARTHRGFMTDVGTRHYAALDASLEMNGSVVYVTSGERPGEMRRLEDGIITYSTIPGEAKKPHVLRSEIISV